MRPSSARPLPVAPAGLLLLTLVLASSGCGDPDLNGVKGQFEVAETQLDFGAVLEGEEVVRQLTLSSIGKGALQVELEVAAPFSAPASVTLLPGAVVPVEVRFRAPASLVTGTLTARAGKGQVEVALRGEGVRPLTCVPSGPCRTSTFSLETRSCVEEVAANGAACTPDSVCLENGLCVEGECLGTPRSCDDGNVCTDDACAEGRGCVSLPHACPPPTRPCWMATCDPTTGCGEAPSPAGTPCGEVTCEVANLCDGMGSCLRFTAPATDGVPCGPASPCRDAPVCQGGTCAVPDAGPLHPLFAQPLPAAAEVVLRGERGQVFASVCSPDADAGCSLHSYTGLVPGAQVGLIERYPAPVALPEASRLVSVSPQGVLVQQEGALLSFHRDSGGAQWRFAPEELLACTPDAPRGWHARTAPDRIATTGEGGVLATFSWSEGPDAADGGARDGGESDGGESDGGTPDGGAADAGDVDGGALDGGAVDGGGPDAGDTCELPLEPPTDEATQTLVALGADGGLQWTADVSALGTESLVALAADGTALLFTPGGALALATLQTDGGAPEVRWLADAGAGPRTLVADAVHGVAGTALFGLDGGGALLPLEGAVDAGALLSPEGQPALLGARAVYRLERVCASDAGACEGATWLSSSLAADGTPQWGLELLPAQAQGRVVETALLRLGTQEAVGVVSAFGGDAGVQGALHLVAGGMQAEVCLLEPNVRPLQALFESGALYLVVEREGKVRLEAYDLEGLQATPGGWPQAAGVSGTRRGR